MSKILLRSATFAQLAKPNRDLIDALSERLDGLDLSGIENAMTIRAAVTRYYPYRDTPYAAERWTRSARRIEGGMNDRHHSATRPSYCSIIESVLEGRSKFVTVACDHTLFAKNTIAFMPTVADAYGLPPNTPFVLRDTGGHFYGAGKRMGPNGEEPFDVAAAWRPSTELELARMRVLNSDGPGEDKSRYALMPRIPHYQDIIITGAIYNGPIITEPQYKE